jgi:hypothetical protein
VALLDRRRRWSLLSAALCCALAGAARAQTGLGVPFPDPLGTFRGVVVDRDGRAIGENVVQNLLREDGRVYLRSEARIEGTAGNLLEAELEPIPGRAGLLRPIWQRTRMPTRAGDQLMDLFVDHRRRRARCTPPGGETRELALAEGERIANVAMNLALRPLAAGAVDAVRFEMLLCEGWQPVVTVEARAQARPDGAPVEMRLGFDLGARVVTALFERFLPDIRIWMRPEPPNEWIAHRLPVQRGGPIIAIVREGIDPAPYLPPPE